MVTRIGWAMLIAGLLFVASAEAQTWDGGGAAGGAVTWTTATNWNPDGVPANNGTANIIMAGTFDTTNTVDVNFDILSLTFNNTAGAFVINNSGGAMLTIRNGGILNQDAQTQTINAPLILFSPQIWNAASGSLTIGGTVNLGAIQLAVDGGFTTTINGIVQNTSGAIVKNGVGTLDISGNNLHTGGLLLNNGVLIISNNGAAGTGTLSLGGGTIQAGGAPRTLANAVTLAGNFSVSGANDMNFSGAATLNDNRTITVNNGLTTFSGAIGQDIPGRNLVKLGTGTMTFSGGSANTYTGETFVVAGTLLLNKTAGVNAIASSAVTVGDALGGVDADVLRLGASDQIVNTSTVNLNVAGLFDLAGFSETINTLALNGGRVTMGAGTLTLTSALSFQGAGTTSTVSGNLNLNGGVRTFDILNGAQPTDVDVSAVIANGGVTKTGTGTILFSGPANTYTGTTTVTGGVLVLGKTGTNGTILGDLIIGDGIGSEQVVVGSASQIANSANVTINANCELFLNAEEDGFGLLTLNGGGVSFAAGGVMTLANDVVVNPATTEAFFNGGLDAWMSLGGTRTFTVADSTLPVELDIDTILLNGTLVKNGLGTLRLSGAQSNAVGATINAGTLIADKNSNDIAALSGNIVIGDGLGGADADVLVIGDNAQLDQSGSDTLTINSSGLLDLGGNVESVGHLIFNGGRTTAGELRFVGNDEVTVNANAQTATIGSSMFLDGVSNDFVVADGAAAVDLNITGSITAGTINKSGAGSMQITNTASFTAVINVNEGTLLLANPSTSSIQGTLTIGDGTGGQGVDVARLMANNQLSDVAVAVSVQSSGLLDLNGFSDTVGSLYMSGGIITTGAGTLSLGAFLEAFANPATSSVAGNVGLGSAPRSFNVHDGAPAIDLDVTATITGSTGGQLIKEGAGTMQLSGAHNVPIVLNAGTLAAAFTIGPSGSLTQNAGTTVTGTLTNQGTFTYNGGTFTGRLINAGTTALGANFTAGNGIENQSSMIVAAASIVTANGTGFSNVGVLALEGGVIAGSGPFVNDFGGTMAARGQITNTTFTNNGTMTLSGVLTLGGAATNLGSIAVATNQSLRPDGGLTNSGLINLTNGGIGGAGTITNSNSGTIQGSGGISIPVTNNGGIIETTAGTTLVLSNFSGGNINGGHLEIADNSQLTSPLAFASGGTIVLKGANAIVAGGAITNTGTISGLGRVSNSVANSGTIRAEAGQLNLSGASATNTVGGQIQAATGASIYYTQGLATNAGVIALTGGLFDNNSRPLANTGWITGYGTVRTGGLTNANLLSVGAGDMNVFGNVTNNGTVNVQAGRTLYFHNNVSGSGNYTGTGTVVYLGSFSPGSSPASVSFAGNVDLTGSASLVMELGGLAPGAEYDQVHVTGQLSLDSALQVSFINGFTPALGNAFDILDWGVLAGTFSSLELPTLGGTLTWDTSQLHISGVLSIGSSVNLPGDYNGDGSVDAADYVVWRKNDGTNNTLPNDLIGGTIGPAQYNQWRANFGQSVGNGSVSDVAVPEPASALLLILAALGTWRGGRMPLRVPSTR